MAALTPSSSSGSEDDEEKRKLAQAVDPDFGKCTNYQRKRGSGEVKNNTSNESEDMPVSKRSKLFEEGAEGTEFAKPYSLDVTPECQKFIAKKLAKSLDRSVKEVSPPTPSSIKSMKGADFGIKLFATSQNLVTEEDLKPSAKSPRKPLKRKHKKKKKSSQSLDSTDSSSEDETEKLKSVAVSADWVFNGS